MTNDAAPAGLPLGLLELDPSGKVLYFKPEGNGSSTPEAADLTGRNLFDDIPVLAYAKEFRERLHSFRRNHAPPTASPTPSLLSTAACGRKYCWRASTNNQPSAIWSRY